MYARTLGGVGLLSVALLAGWTISQPGQANERLDEHGHDAIMQQCAKACSDCQRACDLCATHCAKLLKAGQGDHDVTLMTCRDCAAVCAAAARIVAGEGPFSGLICQACEDACRRCGEACEKFPDDPHMRACAEECRRCEKACREMLDHWK